MNISRLAFGGLLLVVLAAMPLSSLALTSDVPERGEVIAVYPERSIVVISGREYFVPPDARVAIHEGGGSEARQRAAATGTREGGARLVEIELTDLHRGMRVTYTLGEATDRMPAIRYLTVVEREAR